MAKLVTAYQTTDGNLWATAEEAASAQSRIDLSIDYRNAFSKALKSVPKYGKLVGESKAVFSRNAGNINAIGVYRELLRSYTSQFANVMDSYAKDTGISK